MSAAAIAAANEAFYTAFRAGDLETITALWAERAPVVCIHPGWDALIDRADIIESWRAILANGGTDIRCVRPRILTTGDHALVVCEEHLPQGVLVATNGFVREGGVWRLSFHQASPLQQRFESEDADDPGVVMH
ncbi:MAG: DUF4440 domain-containing protein [Alphaproteobacteria bacterium]|nr:nuclear transport factor 2 family protein [Alphaproteobacteria bacterium]TAD92011.1 MAG: DUF4440 domain-containing protein [Alphaproteobacteria bacterium]